MTDLVAMVAGRAPSGRKYEAPDVTPGLRTAALAYLAGYAGSFAFLVDLQRRRGPLSDGQLKGVLNCMLADHRRAASPATPAASPAIAVPDGTYTVVFPGDGHLTLRVRAVAHAETMARPMPAGTRKVQYLSGPDNESSYTSFAWLLPAGDGAYQVRVWQAHAGSKAARALAVLAAAGRDEREGMGRAYALASGNCYICNRLLTTPESIAAGIGPVCAAGRE